MNHEQNDYSEQNTRPTKRPRLLPDGFEPSISVSRHSRKVLNVGSDFHGKASASTSRPIQPSLVQSPDFGAPLGPRAATKPNGTAPQLTTPLRPPKSATTKPKSASGRLDTVKVSAFRPAFSQSSERPSDVMANTRQSKTTSMLYNPPVIKSQADDSLRPVPGPPSLPLVKNSGPPPLCQSKLKTISTTRVAIATDPRTDNGSAELFSLLFQQRGSTYVDALDRELGRGLEQSPEKLKGGGPNVRGGLAESFSRRFAQINTDQKLWEEHIARLLADGKRRVKPDLRLKIVNILHRSPLPGNTSLTSLKSRCPLVTLVKCVVVDARELEFQKGKEMTVLFRHSMQAKTLDLQLAEDDEVYVWRPWHELSSIGDHPESVNASHSLLPVWLCSRFHVPRPADANPSK
ncbi:hypothetical protein BC835DRAFT_721486 [Cytidiella melzeri]|nr:hypothetical protein BC835DRAFT_721486 [Cytidiella melzeri]